MWVCIVGMIGRALAGEAELDIERGRVAFELERYMAARDRAIEALAEAPNLASAHQLYVDATTAAGLGSRGLFELVSYEVETPAWHPLVEALEQAVADEDWKSIRDATNQLVVGWPGSHDLLAPLWKSRSRKVVRMRTRWLGDLADADALATADVESLYRLRRLTMDVGADAVRTVVERSLVDHGEDAPPPRLPLDRLQRTDLALQLSKEPVPALPWGYPGELVDTTLRLEELWARSRRFRHVAMAWQQVQRLSDDPTAWTHEATAWLAENELEKASVAAHAAIGRATRPRSIDLVALNEDRQRLDLSAALLARARVYEAKGDVVRAYGDYAAAVLLAEKILDEKLGERLETTSFVAAQQVTRSYPGSSPAENALAAAARGSDHEKILGNASDARFLIALGSRGGRSIAEVPEVYADLFARSWWLEAKAEAQAGKVENARTAAVLATLLSGHDHPYWWSLRADLQDKNGEYDAAFASWAIARGLGVRDLDEALQRSYIGVSDWEVAASMLGGAPPSEAAVDRGNVSSAPRPRAPRADRPASAPRLGEPFPAFSIDTGYGVLTNRSLTGRIAVVTFWNADCGECLQMLPAFGTLARRLRGEGRDMMVVGVSVDSDPAEFERVFVQGQRWAELVWAPQLNDKFAVTNLPTTWVIDTAGVARYYVDHWLSVEELETYVRDVH